jgi:hypothetical protein
MIELLLAAVLFAGPLQSAEGWKGIVPLITKRSDVEKILGIRTDCENSCLYDINDDRIFVRYASEPCSKENTWTVPGGTVFEISVEVGDNPKISSLKLDRRKFKKTLDPELNGYYSYENEEQGITYTVSERDRVIGIHWWGTAERRQKLRCSLKQTLQDNTALFSRIENAIQQKAPNWKLEKMRITKDERYAHYKWKSGNSWVTIIMLAHTSSEEIAKNFDALAIDLGVAGLTMRKLGSSLQNLGDENYLWEGYYDKKQTGVYFRKGRVIVNVSASSLEKAKQFAIHVADEIPSTF